VLSFGAPIWLLAATGMLIPLLIHWWRSRAGRVLSIPTVRFLEKDAKAVARKRKLQDLLLLLVRCLLFVLAACWLAKPLLQKRKNTVTRNSGWLLISDDVRANALSTYADLIDSLQRQGYQRRAFRKDFPLLTAKTDSLDTVIPYFSLLDAADRQMRDDQSLYLITGDDRQRFGNSKPGLSHELHWKLLPKKRTEEIDTAVNITVAIQADPNSKDAAYLKAAFTALQRTEMPGLLMIDYQPGITVDWLFWLDGKAPATTTATHILQYVDGPIAEQDSWLKAVANPSADRPALYRQSIAENKNRGTVWWSNAQGVPVLWSAPDNAGRLYFSSRFDPAWNELVWSASFPEWLAGLVNQNLQPANNPVEETELHDFPPATAKAAVLTTEKPIPDWYWIGMLLLLFMLERLLSYRKTGGA